MLKRLLKKYELLFLIVFACYVVFSFLDKTILTVDYDIVDKISKYGRYVTYASMALLALLNFKKIIAYLKGLWQKNKILLLFYALFYISVIVSFCLYRVNPNMLIICVMMLAIIGVDFKKVFRLLYRLQFFLSIAILILYFSGVARDYLVYRSNGDIRHSFGFIYTTTLPCFFSSFLVLYTCDKKSKVPIYQLLLFTIASVLLLIFTDSRLEFAVALSVILIAILQKIRPTRVKKCINAMANVIFSVFSKLFWVLPIAWFCLVMLFSTKDTFVVELNKVLSNRLSQTHSVMTEDKTITMFGSSVVLKGNSADTKKEYGRYESNFVDDDYARGMVYHGVMFTICEIVLLEAMIAILWKTRQKNLLLFCMVSLLAAFIDSRMMTTVYCPIFLLIPSVFADYSKNTDKK